MVRRDISFEMRLSASDKDCITILEELQIGSVSARDLGHRNAVLRSSGLASSSLSSWKPSSRSRLNLRSEYSLLIDLSRRSRLCASALNPTNPSPSSSSNRLPSPSPSPSLYRPPGARHAEGRIYRTIASDIRDRREEVCCDMVSRGRYCAYLWRWRR